MIGTDYVQSVLTTASCLRKAHGLPRAAGLVLLRMLARLAGGTVLVCFHKPVGQVGPCEGRLLSPREIECASLDALLDLPREFVAAARYSRCYGVVIDEQVRCYAWTSSEPVRAVSGTVVHMSPHAAYVFKAFTDPRFRRRGLFRECLKAIEQGAKHDGRDEVTALVEVHNRSSLLAFRSAGFERCGFVFVLRHPWLVRRIGCRCASPCTWQRDIESAPASQLRSSAKTLTPECE